MIYTIKKENIYRNKFTNNKNLLDIRHKINKIK